MAAQEGSEVADPGLARRPAPVRAEVWNGVIDIDGTAHSGGVWEYISRVTQQELFTQSCRDFVAIDRDVTGRQIDHRFTLIVQRSPSSICSRLSSTGPTFSTRAIPLPAVTASALRCT